ncbi:MAG: hypothetical protein JWN03_1723 [Nocardia sp.]|uniref:DUF4189 domain-containing protein n=1 Tax=Nocardia sp. TaxID=1821 RepID=UPI0026249984|nr:DUF4189 domain-containing protein [Nocardia sp.]MCU1641448.1 hypothetical protein [Nocardia sp.]
MTLSRKAALGLVACTAGALVTGTAGAAHADGSYFGAFATADRGSSIHVVAMWNYPDQASADAAALRDCGDANCVIQLRWADGCAAYSRRDDNLFWATGNTRAEAERNALAAAGPDPNPLLVSLGSAEPSTATVRTSACTANAG